MNGNSSLNGSVTEWYPGSICPVHIGVYEKRVDRLGKYHYWNGAFWGSWSASPEMAVLNKGMKSMDQDSDWRGLSHPSNGDENVGD